MNKSVTLSNRLEATARFVKEGGVLVDVGTDHAYLPVWLVQNGIIKRAIACDIGEKPLKKAYDTVKRHGLLDRISLRLSDGLDAISPDEADEFVFAGMGGTLISKLIMRAPWLKNKEKHLILQPQTRAEELRQMLTENGFEILGERAVFEGKRVYIAMHASFSGVKSEYDSSYAYIGRLTDNLDNAAREYLKSQAKRVAMKIEGFNISGDSQSVALYSKILSKINEVIYD